MRETTLGTPRSVKEEREEVLPGTGAEIPSQPMEETMVMQVVHAACGEHHIR